jgi:hypothetical protein
LCIVLQRSPNSSGHSRGQDSGRSGGGGNRSGRHNEPVPPPPQQQQQQQDSGRPKEKNNGYVVRPPGNEPLDGHRRYTKIREINSGAELPRVNLIQGVSHCMHALCSLQSCTWML